MEECKRISPATKIEPTRSIAIGGRRDDGLRSAGEACDRALALSAVIALSISAEHAEVVQWLEEEQLMAALTPLERRFLFEDGHASKRSRIQFSWHIERLAVLLWAIGRLDQLPPCDVECPSDILLDVLLPYSDESVQAFRGRARLRSEDELFDFAEQIQRLNAVARKRETDSAYRPELPPVDGEVVWERHIAANWLVGYCGQDWDVVTADT